MVYRAVYDLMFAVNMLLCIFGFGLCAATCVVYWVKRDGQEGTKAHYYFRSLVLVNGGIGFLLAVASYSLVHTSLHHNDVSIFIFPFGLLAVFWGLVRKIRYYATGGKP